MNKPFSGDLSLGRIQPQATELESAVLGILMLEKGHLEEVKGIIPEPECFYQPENQTVYAAILRMKESGKAIDLLTVTQEMADAGELQSIGGAYYLTKLTLEVSNGAHVLEHATIVMEKFMLREAIKVAGQVITEAYDNGDPFDLQTKFLEGMNRIFENRSLTGWVSIDQVAKEYLQEYEDRKHGKTGMVISTTFPYIDGKNGGLKPTNFILIGARPGMGKSAIVLPIIRNTAKTVGPVGIINLEMGNTQTFGRLVSQDSGVGYMDIENGYNISEDRLINHVGELSKLPVFFNTQASMNINGIVSAVTWLKAKKGVVLIVIDYLQLVEAEKKNSRENEVSGISRKLKLLAMALNIPIIALSQLNRECEKRADKKPVKSDLRESGSLEQDADIIWLLHRDWEAGIETNADGGTTENEADLMVVKWRNGKTGNVKLHFDGPTMKFSEPDPFADMPPPTYDNPFAGIKGYANHPKYNDND